MYRRRYIYQATTQPPKDLPQLVVAPVTSYLPETLQLHLPTWPSALLLIAGLALAPVFVPPAAGELEGAAWQPSVLRYSYPVPSLAAPYSSGAIQPLTALPEKVNAVSSESGGIAVVAYPLGRTALTFITGTAPMPVFVPAGVAAPSNVSAWQPEVVIYRAAPDVLRPSYAIQPIFVPPDAGELESAAWQQLTGRYIEAPYAVRPSYSIAPIFVPPDAGELETAAWQPQLLNPPRQPSFQSALNSAGSTKPDKDLPQLVVSVVSSYQPATLQPYPPKGHERAQQFYAGQVAPILAQAFLPPVDHLVPAWNVIQGVRLAPRSPVLVAGAAEPVFVPAVPVIPLLASFYVPTQWPHYPQVSLIAVDGSLSKGILTTPGGPPAWLQPPITPHPPPFPTLAVLSIAGQLANIQPIPFVAPQPLNIGWLETGRLLVPRYVVHIAAQTIVTINSGQLKGLQQVPLLTWLPMPEGTPAFMPIPPFNHSQVVAPVFVEPVTLYTLPLMGIGR